jgi:ABC-type transport system substrate-binding protein
MWSHKSDPIALLAWVDNVSDPDIQNYRVLQSGGNWSQNADPELDVLLKQIASEMDPETRKALIVKQQHYMRQSYPLAYLLQIGIICGVSPKLSWWEPMPNDAHRFFRVTGSN